jgi:hypothetical protein
MSEEKLLRKLTEVQDELREVRVSKIGDSLETIQHVADQVSELIDLLIREKGYKKTIYGEWEKNK